MFSLIPVILKKFNIPLQYIITLGLLAVFIPSIIIFKSYKSKKYKLKDLFKKQKIIIGILNTIYIHCLYIGFKILPVSIAIPIFMLSPIIMSFFDRFINKNDLNIGQLLFLIISFIGIILVVFSKSKKSINNKNYGIILMICSAILYSYIFTILKDNKNEKQKPISTPTPTPIQNSNHIGFDFYEINYQLLTLNIIPTIISLFISIVIFIVFNTNKKILPTFLQYTCSLSSYKCINPLHILFLFIAFFILSYLGNILYLYAYNNLSIATYGIIENMEVIASLIIGYFFMKEKITILKIIGCFLIVGGIIGEILIKKNKKLPKI